MKHSFPLKNLKKQRFCLFFSTVFFLLMHLLASCDSPSQRPGEVTGLLAVSGNNTVTLSWADPDCDNLAHIEITWSPDAPASPEVIDAGVETALITDLTNGREYTFRVSTVDTDNSISAGITIAATPGVAGEFYVATDGDDSSPGTLSAPWQTVQKAASTVPAGSTVYVRNGIYNEQISINVSGSASAGYTTFRNFDNETPVLDGTGLMVPGEDSGMFMIANQKYIIIQGFEIRNYRSTERDIVPVGINIRGTSHHITIRNNLIHNIETNASVDTGLSGADAHGIAVYGTHAPESVNNIIIDSNEIHDLKLGSSEAIVVNGNVEMFTISNNVIHDLDNIAIDVIGFEETSPDESFDQARNGIIINNMIYNASSFGNPSYGDEYSADGIYVDGGKDTIIEMNVVYNTDIGVEIASEHRNRSTSNIIVRNNFLYNNILKGIALGGYDQLRGSTENCIIVNNTLYNNDTQQDGSGEIGLGYDTKNNIIKNNIFFTNAQSLFIDNSFKENSGNMVDYNLYFAKAGPDKSSWKWKNKDYENFEEYRTATGNDSHSMFVNPEFVDPDLPDLHLHADSPAIDRGESISKSGTTDIDGQDRVQGDRIDIGADETP